MHADKRHEEAPGVLPRADRVLSCFTTERPRLTLAELTRLTGLPKSTVFRLVGDLTDLGLLEREGATFRLGMRLFELGHRVTLPRLLRDTALPFMDVLHQTTRQSVYLAVLDGPDVVFVESLSSPTGPLLPVRAGTRLPAYCTAVGRALLAHAQPPQLDAVMAAGLHRRMPHTVTAPGALLRRLAAVRSTGVAVEYEEFDNVACTASPVWGRDGRVTAALSVTGRATSRGGHERIAAIVRESAHGMSRALST